MSNKTSIEWLIEQICGDHTGAWEEQIAQAKAMHKEEVERAWRNGDGIFDLTSDIFAEKYYNKMFTNTNDTN